MRSWIRLHRFFHRTDFGALRLDLGQQVFHFSFGELQYVQSRTLDFVGPENRLPKTIVQLKIFNILGQFI
jgi:hypothetical protein